MFHDFYSRKRSAHYDAMKQLLVKRVVQWLPGTTGNVIEIGVGQGEMFREMQKRYVSDTNHVWGLDCHEDQLATVPPHRRILCRLPMVPDSYIMSIGDDKIVRKRLRRVFGLIYCAHVLEHMPDYTTSLATMEAIESMLTPAGRAVVTVPDYLSWGPFDFWDVDYSHGVPFTMRRLERMAYDAELQITRRTVICGPLLGFPARLLHFAWRCVRWAFRWHPRMRQAGFTLNRDLMVELRRQ